MKNIEAFLKKIGVKPATITALQATDELEATKLDALVNEHVTHAREVMEADPEFVGKIKTGITAKERATIEGKIKKAFGLTSEEIKDKKMEEIMDLAVEKTKAQHTGTADELQTKITELAKENKRLLEEVIPGEQAKAKGEIKTFKRDLKIREKLAGKSFIVDPSIFLPALKADLEKDFDIDVDDDDSLSVKTKKDGLAPLSADKTRKLTIDEILDERLTAMKVLKQSNGTPPPPGGTPPIITPDTGTPRFNLPGLDRAKANEKDMANIRTFGQ